MANVNIEKAEQWASAALGLLEREIVLAGLVSRNAGADFVGARGDVVNIRRPSRLEGTRENLRDMDGDTYEITSEGLDEHSISVPLDQHLYSAVDLSDAELSLDIMDFGARVLTPQVRAIATRAEFMIAERLNALTASTVTLDGDNAIRRGIINLRKQLNENDVPTDSRVLVVGTDVEAELLQDPNLIQADRSGSDSALRNAELGRLLGFRVVVSNTIDADRMVAFHPSAYTLVTRAPSVPASVTSGSSESYAGVAMRAIRDYNSRVAKDRSFLSTFAGVGETTDREVTYGPDGSVTETADNVMLRAVAATVQEPDPA